MLIIKWIILRIVSVLIHRIICSVLSCGEVNFVTKVGVTWMDVVLGMLSLATLSHGRCYALFIRTILRMLPRNEPFSNQ